MSKVRVVLNREGVRQLMRSQEMQGVIDGHARNMAAKSGGEVESYVAQTRAVSIVRGDDGNNSALKAMGGS
jgi:hypothetical protein|uniref:Type I neck protein n=1 Tax=Siphoviridae sp. ctYcY12 TaxID=2825550 RepID=A0A8S5TTW3_9CAUD|nr:MAG TPA: type I neck protein [Siphoviridae sp. ctYcY12]